MFWRRPSSRGWAQLGLLALSAGVYAGCALRYTDVAGRLHTVGLVWHTTTAPTAPPAEGDGALPRFTFRFGPLHDSAALLRQRTLGVALSWTDFNRGVALGYAEQLVVLPSSIEGVTFADYDSRAPLATVLTFDARLRTSTSPLPP